VLAFGSETWVLSKSNEPRLGVFERKVLRAIFGPTNNNGEWRIKYNDELYTLYKDSDIITYNKINHIRWAGHVIRPEEQNPARRVFAAVVEETRQKGRPKLRWEDGVTGDAKKLGEKHWRSTARNRDGWQKLLRKALAQSGLLCQLCACVRARACVFR
jgi:hypothetical protein